MVRTGPRGLPLLCAKREVDVVVEVGVEMEAEAGAVRKATGAGPAPFWTKAEMLVKDEASNTALRGVDGAILLFFNDAIR